MGAAKMKTKSRFAPVKGGPAPVRVATLSNGPAVRVMGLKSLRKLSKRSKE